MKEAWQGQNNRGEPIGIIYYGYLWWPSFSCWMIPGWNSAYRISEKRRQMKPEVRDVLARSFASPNTWDWSEERRQEHYKHADDIIKTLYAAGYVIVPVKPSETMLEELARIGDGPMISGGEVWGYMLAAASADAQTPHLDDKP
jgi:hypothetical protein